MSPICCRLCRMSRRSRRRQGRRQRPHTGWHKANDTKCVHVCSCGQPVVDSDACNERLVAPHSGCYKHQRLTKDSYNRDQEHSKRRHNTTVKPHSHNHTAILPPLPSSHTKPFAVLMAFIAMFITDVLPLLLPPLPPLPPLLPLPPLYPPKIGDESKLLPPYIDGPEEPLGSIDANGLV